MVTGRRLLECKAHELRERTLPDLLRAVANEPEDRVARSAYGTAIDELRRIESALRPAGTDRRHRSGLAG